LENWNKTETKTMQTVTEKLRIRYV